MWDFLFGWWVGTNIKNARNSALPDSVKQERYDAAVAKRQANADAKVSKALPNPTLLLGARVFLAAAFVLLIVALIFR